MNYFYSPLLLSSIHAHAHAHARVHVHAHVGSISDIVPASE